MIKQQVFQPQRNTKKNSNTDMQQLHAVMKIIIQLIQLLYVGLSEPMHIRKVVTDIWERILLL